MRFLIFAVVAQMIIFIILARMAALEEDCVAGNPITIDQVVYECREVK